MAFSFSSKRFGFSKSSMSAKSTDTDTDTDYREEVLPGPSNNNIVGGDEDDDSIPRTKADARNHIDKIRAEKGLHGTDSNTADLQAALVVYVERLALVGSFE